MTRVVIDGERRQGRLPYLDGVHIVRPQGAIATVLCVGAAACSTPTESAVTIREPVSFVLSSTGAEQMSVGGVTIVLPTRPKGFSQRWATGSFTADVVPIVLAGAPETPGAGMTLSIGVLGSLRTGVYRIRRAATNPSGILEFYATLVTPMADGTARQYELETGLFTIIGTNPLHATLDGTSVRMFVVPSDAPPRAVLRSVPAELRLVGTLGR